MIEMRRDNLNVATLFQQCFHAWYLYIRMYLLCICLFILWRDAFKGSFGQNVAFFGFVSNPEGSEPSQVGCFWILWVFPWEGARENQPLLLEHLHVLLVRKWGDKINQTTSCLKK